MTASGDPESAAERALRESEARYRTLFENSPVGLGVADERGTLLAYNEAMMRPGGYTREDIQKIGNVAALYASNDDRDRALALARSQGFLRQHEVLFKRKDGSHYLARLSLEPIALDGRRGWQAMVEDITELKRLEAKAQEADKFESVGRLAGGVAHELNNMLTVILGYADGLGRRIPEARQDLDPIRESATRAAGLVRALLGFARKQSARPQAVNANVLLEKMRDRLAGTLSNGVLLRTEMAAELPSLWIDPAQFEDVLLHLATNARDAMPAGGTLTIRTERATQAGEFVRVVLSDTGTGMPPEVLEHLFEPFFTTKTIGNGAGLGLATCYGILKQNGGHITAESVPGKGSIFSLLFPAARESSPAAIDPPGTSITRPPTGRPLVLVAEDESSVRRIVTATLREAGYDVLEAPDGKLALQALEESARAANALVTDLVMPVMGGRELAERLWQRDPLLPVLFMSGYAKDDLGPDILNRPGVRFLQKPFGPELVREALNQLLAGAPGR
ncbi:MAG: ATP-binding protein [Planctomycetota bacterium]